MAKVGTHLYVVEKHNSVTGAANSETLRTKNGGKGYGVIYYDCGGASRTGVIVEAGVENGQSITIVNNSDAAETITFATDATSNVAGGTGIVIGQNEKRTFTWSTSLSRWVPEETGNAVLGSLQNSSHYVVAAGQFTTAGGDAAEQATVAGVVATDIVVASIEDNGTNNVTLLQSAAGAGVIDFTMSADPSTDAIINYLVLRAV